MWKVLLFLIPLVLAQQEWDPVSKTWRDKGAAQPNASPATGSAGQTWDGQKWVSAGATGAASNNPHEVNPSPNPGPFVHRDYHPKPMAPVPMSPVGNVEQRLRRLEVFLGLIDPECRNPHTGPTSEFRRMTYPTQPEKIFHASEPARQDTARRAGYTQEEVLGRLATEASNAGCECLIPLYRRNYDNHVYRIQYRTKDTYPCRKNFLTSKDFPAYDYMGDLKNWAIEGYCVPYRGACGANLQLSAMFPTKELGDDRPMTLVTSDSDRVKYGNEKGWDETTLCYIWNP